MTPIEEIRVRDGLAEIAKTILQFRSNYSATSGSGDSHWPHGYELALGVIALAMPTYKTPCFGVSGGDFETVNDLKGAGQVADGRYWNPFPDQGVTWYEAATDPAIRTPGHPNIRYPFRAEFIYPDDGWWSGPNDLQGDGTHAAHTRRKRLRCACAASREMPIYLCALRTTSGAGCCTG